MDIILKHRSIRKYKSIEPEDEKISKILEAASRASTTGSMQVYSIVVTKDKEIRKQLWDSHFKQDMVLQAPVHLTFCADFNRFSKWCEQRSAKPGYDNYLSFLTGAIDALLAAQNAALAAEALGLGICYLGTVTWMADRFIEILKLPQLVVPVAALTIGYPDENPNLTPRLPVEGIVHQEVYSDYSPEDIDAIYQSLENMSETKQIIEENKQETLAQVFTLNRYKKADNQFFSQKFLNTLTQQGFMNNNED
ncbi:MAG: NADPH-dependent oxidoreductase [Bacteroidetes bacterium]|jgi:nitroreductase|nr:NADPH-dependent oxidoreductase [Bacteroidota bacterium]MBT3748450.1 NADPH-dependent oxidoreductase [Bacteroidota bacterium]MBT4398069.1 NADPH-dependent oxidoreductase [Bacteroidota bacterium]MBT4409929.1 NADPH-dependent oxidoreductase [Bacteroidota bacterium]MBT5424726.1 NADPH-dependent oxidoreductase [Bacteroidota bacterium]